MTKGTELYDLRKSRKVKAVALAHHLGVHRGTLHTYERLADVESQVGTDFVSRYRDGVELLAKKG